MFGKKESQSEKNSSGHTKITSHAWTVCEYCGEMMFVPRIHVAMNIAEARGRESIKRMDIEELKKANEFIGKKEQNLREMLYECYQYRIVDAELDCVLEFMAELGYTYTYDGFAKEEGTKQWENT